MDMNLEIRLIQVDVPGRVLAMPTLAQRALWVGAALLVVLAMTVTACGDDREPDGDNPVATFAVSGETFRIELATPELLEHARLLLASEPVASIPNGLVVRSNSDVNEPWSWHIEPSSLEFADATAEVCDGLPSDVEAATITSDRYCPWAATVVAIDE